MLTTKTPASEFFELNGRFVKEGAQFTLHATGETFVFTRATSYCHHCTFDQRDDLCKHINCTGGIWTTPVALLNYKISGKLHEPSST